NIDLTAPVVEILTPINGSSSTTAQTLIYTADDNLSGVDQTTPTNGTEYSDVGDYDVTVTATDFAGNVGTALVIFSIASPTSTSSSTLPLQEQLRYKLPFLEEFSQYQVTPVDLMSSIDIVGPTYFYHPLTPFDMSAFDQFFLEEGAYDFIDGILKKKVPAPVVTF
ncbi:MAG TPA: hypothetical protein DCL35_08195, partial [Candidatus Omnitrophica bacterium]|nr:hypothetical protein [Candidatus Omnitrophota bacterium]